MATDKQREANRRNALLSTGPRTPEGRAISAQNSFKHGLCADDSTLFDDPETKADIEKHLAATSPNHPSNTTPSKKSPSARSLRHLQRAQNGLINDAREKMFDKHTFTDPEGNLHHYYDVASHSPEDERHIANRLLGVAWQSVASDLDKMSRYEARIHTRYQKALKPSNPYAARQPRRPNRKLKVGRPPARQNRKRNAVRGFGCRRRGAVGRPILARSRLSGGHGWPYL
jgi:hypothetical protein